MQATAKTLHLQAPIQIRILSNLIILLGYAMSIFLFEDRVQIFALLFWTAIFLRGIFYAPEITVFASGIETRRFGIRHFTHWYEVKAVRIGRYVSQIYPKNIHPLTRYFLYSYLMIIYWRSNYKEAMEIIRENVQEFQAKKPQRIYE